MTVRYDVPNRAARAANAVIRWLAEVGISIAEVADDAKPELLKRYLDRWHWEVKGHAGGLTPESTTEQISAAAPSIPVFELID